MKTLFNWRYIVIILLFAAGSLSLLLAFGDTAVPTNNAKTITLMLLFFSLGIASFYTLARLIKHWADKGEISQVTNLINAYDGNEDM